MATNYLDMVDAIKALYRETPQNDLWVRATNYGLVEQDWQYLKQVPGISIVQSPSGKFLGYDYETPFPELPNTASLVDSNVQTGEYGLTTFNANVPGTAIVDQQTGQITSWESGVRPVNTGSVVPSVADKVSLGIAGVALGTKLGALIDGAIYSIDPNWWDEHYPSINPLTWDDYIAGDNETGKWVVRTIFGLPDENTNDMTMYMDERMLAYTYAMLLENGVWDSGDEYTYDGSTSSFPQPSITTCFIATSVAYRNGNNVREITGENALLVVSLSGSTYTVMAFSNASGGYMHDAIVGTSQVSNYPVNNRTTTYNNTPYYYSAQDSFSASNLIGIAGGTNSLRVNVGSEMRQIATILFDGTASSGGLDGISPNNPEASTHIVPSNVINPTTGNPVTPQDNIDDILQALKLAYPDLFLNQVYEDVVQPDGTVERITYNPVPYPDMEDPTKPTTDTTQGVDPQTNPEYNPETRPEEQTQGLTDSITESPTTPATGSGTTPPFVPPAGTANALYAIYNPSQGELNSFGAWLWSSNFVDQLLKLFNDPMQAIIGLHKVFVNPVISGRQNIKVGYLDSGVASNVVGAQYVTVNCGSVTIPEYFGNVFDYDPFTQIYLYLPFVGIQRLDTGDVMRGTLNVVYHCDVLTGACLVEVNVFRDGGGGIIYTYTGNCAVQYPISSGSYMGIIASLASVVGGVVGTIATGGALAPVALGAVSGVMNAHTRVEHSGGFSGNAGAMGIKKPYVIITRPQTCLADNFPAFNGYPANKLTYIGDCTGYIKCDECHIEQVPGTDAELSELENLLKSGIII